MFDCVVSALAVLNIAATFCLFRYIMITSYGSGEKLCSDLLQAASSGGGDRVLYLGHQQKCSALILWPLQYWLRTITFFTCMSYSTESVFAASSAFSMNLLNHPAFTTPT